MGLLMLGGLIGSILYGGYAFKMDAESEIIDSKVKHTTSEVENKKIIQQNFKLICKRGRIKLDNGLPINEKHYNRHLHKCTSDDLFSSFTFLS